MIDCRPQVGKGDVPTYGMNLNRAMKLFDLDHTFYKVPYHLKDDYDPHIDSEFERDLEIKMMEMAGDIERKFKSALKDFTWNAVQYVRVNKWWDLKRQLAIIKCKHFRTILEKESMMVIEEFVFGLCVFDLLHSEEDEDVHSKVYFRRNYSFTC